MVDQSFETVTKVMHILGARLSHRRRSRSPSLAGSQYWIESAIIALINACQSFTDEGFIEVSIWAEASMRGEAELYVRARDTGLTWSTDDDAEHGAVRILREILSGLGFTLMNKDIEFLQKSII